MMNNSQVMALTQAHVMNTYGRMPLALVRGKGTYVWDADGRRYIDFVTGVAVNSLGHCHPRVVEAITTAASTLIHCSNHYHIESQARLAALLTAKAGLGKAFFCNSGAESVESAIKLARRYAKEFVSSERYEIITAINSFHGRTMGAVSATGQKKYHKGFEPMLPGFSYVPLNDEAALRKAFNSKTAAVMLEPIQGEGGVQPCTQAYLALARELCSTAGIPLIFDEVQTGLGRTGKWFAFQHYNIQPDIITLAKALGGGVPIGCILANDQVAQGFVPGTHASTFGGNPLATNAALATMQVMEEEGLVEQAATIGQLIKARLTALAEKYPQLVVQVRGQGCLIGMQLHVSAAPLVKAALAKGLLINAAGSNVLRLLPPLNASTDVIEAALTIIEEVLAEQVASC